MLAITASISAATSGARLPCGAGVPALLDGALVVVGPGVGDPMATWLADGEGREGEGLGVGGPKTLNAISSTAPMAATATPPATNQPRLDSRFGLMGGGGSGGGGDEPTDWKGAGHSELTRRIVAADGAPMQRCPFLHHLMAGPFMLDG
jgi:hypothetical protein